MYKFSIQYTITVDGVRQPLSGLTVKLVKPGANWASGITIPEAAADTGYYELATIETPGFFDIWDDETSEAGAFSGKTITVGPLDATGIQDGSVTGEKIAANSVGSGHLGEGVVTDDKIAPAAVGESHLEEGAVTGSRIANGAVGSDKLAPGAANGQIETYFGTRIVTSRNYFNPALNASPYNRYLSVGGAIVTGLDGRLTGYIPVTAGKTYMFWLDKYPDSAAANPPAWYDSGKYFACYSYNGSTYAFLGMAHNANTWSSGEVPNAVFSDSFRVAKIMVPTGCTHIMSWIRDIGETNTPQTSYYPSMSAFNGCVMAERYDNYEDALKATFEAYYAAYTLIKTDLMDLSGKVGSAQIVDGSITADKLDPNIDYGVDAAIETYFGTRIVTSRNYFNPALNAYPYNRYLSTGGAIITGLSGRVTGYIPVTAGKTYMIWLAKYPDSEAADPPAWYNSGAFFACYAYNGSTYAFLGMAHNANTWSSGEVPNAVFSDSFRVAKIMVPTGCTHIMSWIADAGEANNPKTSYYPSMSAFNGCVMAERYDNYEDALKTTFEAYYAAVEKLVPDKLDLVPSVTAIIGAMPDAPASGYNVIAKKSGNFVYARSRFNNTYDALIILALNHVSGAGFTSEYLIPIGNEDSDFTTGRINIKASVDDHYPPCINQGYIGGNHGLSSVYKITKTAHGLTFSDIGTVWADQTSPTPKEFAIVSIIDSNNIVVAGKDTSVTDMWSLQQTVSGTVLSEIGGSSRSLSGWTVTPVQWTLGLTLFPHLTTPMVSVKINGITPAVNDTLYYCDFVDIVSEYCILNPGNMRKYATDNVGSFTANITQAQADSSIQRNCRNRQLFRCQGYGALLLDYTIEFYQQTTILYIGFVQATAIADVAGAKIYAPRATVNNSKSVDCRIRNFVTPFSEWSPTFTDMDDADKPTDRVIQLLYDGDTLSYAWAIGYLEDFALAKPSARSDNSATVWNIYSTRKNYPRLIENTVLDAGTVIHAVSYRQAVHNELFSAHATVAYMHEYAGSLYIYADYHQSVIGSVVLREYLTLPDKYIGKAFSVNDKTSNIQVLVSDYVPSTGIIMDVDCTTDVYGYVIIKVIL